MFEQINEALKKQVNKKGLSQAAQSSYVCYVANQISDNRYKAISFKNGVLEIQVKNNYEAMIIQAQQKETINKINNQLNRKIITRVKYKVQN